MFTWRKSNVSVSFSLFLFLVVHSVALHAHTHTHTFLATHMCNAIKSFFNFSCWWPRWPLHHWRVPSWRTGPRQQLTLRHTCFLWLTKKDTHAQPLYENKVLHFCPSTHATVFLQQVMKSHSPQSRARKSKCCQAIKQIRPLRQE